MDAGQKERKRLERNLHDGAQQRLIALSLDLGLLEENLKGDQPTRLRLDRARSEIATSLEELRAVAHGIHPAVVSGHGLEIALQRAHRSGAGAGAAKRRMSRRLPERLEVAAFYLVSESLANIGKHASATTATVEVTHTNGHVVVEVVDDGVGGTDPERGSGLRGLADRVEALDGRAPDLEPEGRRHPTASGDPVRVVIAEDSVLLREGLERLLSENGLDVIGTCETAEELLSHVRTDAPDVVIVDIRLPPTHNDEGMRAALQIRADHPSVGVLVLSQYVELGLAISLIADSAQGAGYLLKDRVSDVPEFMAAVRRVATGGSAIDPLIVSTLISKRRADDPLARLTPRERAVLELMAQGSSNQGIADRLVITVRSVEKYTSSVFDKLGLPSSPSESRRVLAVLLYLHS